MKYLSSQQPITLAALAAAFLGIVLAAFSLYQVQALSSSVDAVSTKAEELLSNLVFKP